MMSFLFLLTMVQAQSDRTATEAFEAPKYGVTTQIPSAWPVKVREKEDRVFVAFIPQDDPDRPGVAACELALSPESLEDYRTRIDSNARNHGRQSGKLASNKLIKDQRGQRLETTWEFHPNSGGFWHEITVRVIAHRQLYSFILSVEDAHYAAARPAFDAMVAATRFSPPNTGADLLNKASNRWVQREYRFALDLPRDWSPVLAPSEVALLFADGPAHGVWSDNVLVLAHPRATGISTSRQKNCPACSSRKTRTARSSRARSCPRGRVWPSRPLSALAADHSR